MVDIMSFKVPLFIISCIIYYGTLHLIAPSLVASVDDYRKGNMRRLLTVMRAEMIMLLLTIITYRRLMALFQVEKTSTKSFERRIAAILTEHRSIAHAIIVGWLVLAHLFYALFYAPIIIQSALFYISAVAQGDTSYQ
jgi:hypothetical protein